MIDMYIGETSREKRKVVETSCRIILSTYHMAKEGLDIKRLDTLVFATPKSDIEQAIGRIQRPSTEKNTPFVIDLVDNCPAFMSLKNRRVKHYNARKYKILVGDMYDTK